MKDEAGKALMRQTVADALRARVGRGRDWSVADFADATGYSESSIENWRNEASTPELDAYARMCAVLGDSFRDEVTPASSNADACMHGVATEALGVTSSFMEAKADGVVCPQERAHFAEALRRLIDKGKGWLRRHA